MSVAISTIGRPDLVIRTVRSVLAGDAVPAEILVADQNPVLHTDLAQLAADVSTLRLLRGIPTGLSAGRNACLAAATQEMVAMIDDDVEVDPGWLGAMHAALTEGGEWVIVSGRVLPGPTEQPDDWVPSTKVSTVPETHRAPGPKDVVWGNNFGMWRRAFRTVGPFDTRLGPGARWASSDDNDFGYRALRAGLTVRYVPSVCLTHMAWRRGRALYRVQWEYGRGQGGFYAKHGALGDRHLRGRFAADVAVDLRGVLRYAARRDPWAASYALHLLGLVAGFAEWRLREGVSVVTRRRPG